MVGHAWVWVEASLSNTITVLEFTVTVYSKILILLDTV